MVALPFLSRRSTCARLARPHGEERPAAARLKPWGRSILAGEETKARLLDSVASVLDQGSWDLLDRLFPGVARPPHYADSAAVWESDTLRGSSLRTPWGNNLPLNP